MQLNETESALLKNCLLQNGDEETNNEKWAENGIKGAKNFVEQSSGAINLLLGRK
ncbi:MAG: hypothetical protein IT569_08175 [Leptospiraceae bacterium]|nr:hypothetical protein [Leptospiraceae bacterium]